jgi:hypothetical protein
MNSHTGQMKSFTEREMREGLPEREGFDVMLGPRQARRFQQMTPPQRVAEVGAHPRRFKQRQRVSR